MADNTMFAAEKSNIYFGTSLVGNLNEVKLLDMGDLDGSQNARIIARFSGSVNYGISSDVVVYS